ncbi:hypothetical protein PENSTE_c010G08120 [Penicillium steckii]|uniref:Uncharacterized protein n=1 Tax=Penicillium steckii TaxID=303698 RepID=A0A1V6T7S0_9EURO|nr:hypothetical protein PENSTE_c010G08120 [Penicillium steckii]
MYHPLRTKLKKSRITVSRSLALQLTGHEDQILTECYSVRKPSKQKYPMGPRNDRPEIRDRLKAPADWDPNDNDIDSRDVDAVIQRCKERIAEGIMPQIWEQRLKIYEKAKEDYEEFVNSYPEDLSVEVKLRISQLVLIKDHLSKNGDPYNSIQNIEAIIKAYSEKDLKWESNKVTYWSKGKRISEPTEFHWDDFLSKSSENDGQNGFWVESNDTPGPKFCNGAFTMTIPHGNRLPVASPSYKIQFRVPGTQIPIGLNLEMYDDTGSEIINIFENDLNQIILNSGIQAPYISTGLISGVGNNLVPNLNIALEIALIDENHNRVVDWGTWPVSIFPGSVGLQGYRMAGPYLRQTFYTATAPQRPRMLHISSRRSAVGNRLPSRVYCDFTPDRFIWPPERDTEYAIRPGVEWC